MKTNCTKCGAPIRSITDLFCFKCGTGLPARTPDISVIDQNYRNTYGTWKVTTEGDCEGRTTKELGIHEGHIDDIAKSLAPKAFYSLKFKLVTDKEKTLKRPKKNGRVSVQLDIDSKTWDLKNTDRAAVMSEVFKDRLVLIEEGNYYASFDIVW